MRELLANKATKQLKERRVSREGSLPVLTALKGPRSFQEHKSMVGATK
jgi:hypothetical protein